MVLFLNCYPPHFCETRSPTVSVLSDLARLPGPRELSIAFSPALGLQQWATALDFFTWVLDMKLGFR